MNKNDLIVFVSSVVVCTIVSAFLNRVEYDYRLTEHPKHTTQSVITRIPEERVETSEIITTTTSTYISEEPEPMAPTVSDEEKELIALVTMAEAEGECDEGQRLVIDTILNRVDGEYWPDTINDVIYQPNQFASMWNGRIDRCEVRDDILRLVEEELESRTNSDVVFFRTDYYSEYGTPMFQVGSHYFSRY